MSGSTLTTPPATEPVTVEEARSQCRVIDSSEDGSLAGYLLAARGLAEERTGRVLATQTWTQTFDHDWPRPDDPQSHHRHGRSLGFWRGKRQILLRKAPLQTVGSITYVDTTGATQTLDPGQYQVGTRELIGAIDEAYGVCWPAVRRQMDAVTVTYTAGYSAANPMPEGIRLAILLLVGHFYDNRDATVISATRMSVSELPIGIDALLARHVVPWAF